VTGWLSSVQSGPGGGATIQDQSFLYDEVGDVTQRQDGIYGLSENFYYDNDYRLSYSTLNGTQNLSLTYSPMGNITSRSDVAAGATWTYDPVHVHEVTEAGSSAYQYVYDANGNVTSRQGSPITWSSYNYPTAINDTTTDESVSFIYGPDREAWYEATNGPSGTEGAWRVGGLFDVVFSGGVFDYRHYVYAGAKPVAILSRKSSGVNSINYLLTDQQGSVSAIANSAGALVIGESFTAYGSRRNPSTWSGAPASSDLTTIAGITRHGYTFQEVLGSQMGLNDMIGRVQDAITGRFLSADPNIPDPTNPQSYNRYSYTTNNPLTYVDPSGFEEATSPCPAGGCTSGSNDNNEAAPPTVPYPGPPICIGCDDPPPPDLSGLLSYLLNSGPAGNSQSQSAHGGTLAKPSLAPQQQQSVWQKIKNWLCNAGNSLVSHSQTLGSLGLKIEAGGATVTVAGLISQPEVNPEAVVVTGIGLAGMGTGAAAGTLASVMQVGGGIAQMIGSNDSSVGANNAFGGSASLAAGASTGWATGESGAMKQGFAGTMGDAGVSMMPGMSSGQAQCGAN
jgi:RHS repeat-associated protein